MDKDHQTNINVDLGFEINPLRPISSYSESITNAKCADFHAHPRAQIIYANSGVMQVETPNRIWIVNPLQAIWIPGGMEHQVYFPNNVSVCSIFVDPSVAGEFPMLNFAFDISSFFKSLLFKIVSFDNPNEYTEPQKRIIAVFFDELLLIKPSLIFLPTSNDIRIKKITDELMQNVASKQAYN